MAETIMKENVLQNSKLKEFFVEQLEDLYWAENKLIKALRKMEEAATSVRLKEAFNTHREETKKHVSRLEQVFAMINEPVDSTKCPAMAGIISEANDIIDDTDEGSAHRDAGLVIAAQKAEHYEIASYGSLAQLASTLGYTDVKSILGQTLEEEKSTDLLLTEIAKSGINYNASMEEEEIDDVSF